MPSELELDPERHFKKRIGELKKTKESLHSLRLSMDDEVGGSR